MSYLRIKLSLLAFCLLAAAASHVYFRGIDAGVAGVDRQAFEAQVHFARQMKAETHQPRKSTEAHTGSVWAVLGSK